MGIDIWRILHFLSFCVIMVVEDACGPLNLNNGEYSIMKKTIFFVFLIFFLTLTASSVVLAQKAGTTNGLTRAKRVEEKKVVNSQNDDDKKRKLAAATYSLPTTATWQEIAAAHIESERRQVIRQFNLPKNFTWAQVNNYLNSGCSCVSEIDQPYVVTRQSTVKKKPQPTKKRQRTKTGNYRD